MTASTQPIRLRTVRASDGPVLADLDRPENAGPFNTFEVDERRRPPTGLNRMIVEADGAVVGMVSWHIVAYGPNRRSEARNIGITIHPEHRRRGFGSAAQRMLAEHLFETTDVHRVEASTDVRNIAEQRALEAAGFQREGVARGAQHREGRWNDLVVYSLLRSDVADSFSRPGTG